MRENCSVGCEKEGCEDRKALRSLIIIGHQPGWHHHCTQAIHVSLGTSKPSYKSKKHPAVLMFSMQHSNRFNTDHITLTPTYMPIKKYTFQCSCLNLSGGGGRGGRDKVRFTCFLDWKCRGRRSRKAWVQCFIEKLPNFCINGTEIYVLDSALQMMVKKWPDSCDNHTGGLGWWVVKNPTADSGNGNGNVASVVG